MLRGKRMKIKHGVLCGDALLGAKLVAAGQDSPERITSLPYMLNKGKLGQRWMCWSNIPDTGIIAVCWVEHFFMKKSVGLRGKAWFLYVMLTLLPHQNLICFPSLEDATSHTFHGDPSLHWTNSRSKLGCICKPVKSHQNPFCTFVIRRYQHFFKVRQMLCVIPPTVADIVWCCRSGVVLGLSKVARLAKMFAKRFQEQQRFTCQILEAFNAEVQPLGCAAIVEAQHLSQMPSKPHLTFAALGCFYAKPQLYMQVCSIALFPSFPSCTHPSWSFMADVASFTGLWWQRNVAPRSWDLGRPDRHPILLHRGLSGLCRSLGFFWEGRTWAGLSKHAKWVNASQRKTIHHPFRHTQPMALPSAAHQGQWSQLSNQC